MEIINLFLKELNLLQLIVYTVIIIVVQLVLSFYKEKGKNFATKQDITDLTRIVKNIEKEYQENIEFYKILVSNYHTSKFNRIIEFYEYLIDFDTEFKIELDNLKYEPEKRKHLSNLLDKIKFLTLKLNKAKILFPEDLNIMLTNFINSISNSVITINYGRSLEDKYFSTSNPDDLEKSRKIIDEAEQNIKSYLEPLKIKIYEFMGKEIKYK